MIEALAIYRGPENFLSKGSTPWNKSLLLHYRPVSYCVLIIYNVHQLAILMSYTHCRMNKKKQTAMTTSYSSTNWPHANKELHNAPEVIQSSERICCLARDLALINVFLMLNTIYLKIYSATVKSFSSKSKGRRHLYGLGGLSPPPPPHTHTPIKVCLCS